MNCSISTILFRINYTLSITIAFIFHFLLINEDFNEILNYKYFNNETEKWENLNSSLINNNNSKICIITRSNYLG